ncbi:Acylphosphatase [Pseudobythopirellula maris]|uniref:acylphosphatase n=1 Tax=Pseudobythopirellula maris TaxID=2527991 RepID=A0A5C5ZUC1_9BACT|nr:acylphosphatase [Pseudobythopirellula maris]TWT90627.1 Acylphosphatase [Pseudobythopirellula maris]
MASDPKQFRVLYTGRVQGVGFRWTTQQIAGRHDVKGTVRNLDDGRVELVVEATPREARAMLAAIRGQFASNLTDETIDETPATGRHTRFEILR